MSDDQSDQTNVATTPQVADQPVDTIVETEVTSQPEVQQPEAPVSEQAHEEDQKKIAEDQVRQKRIENKMSKLEKEANEAKQYKQQLDTLTNWIKSDEVAYKRALIASGYSEGQADEQLKSLKAQQGQVIQQPQYQQPQAQDPRAIYYQIRGQEKFFEAVPDMNPKNIKLEDREEKAELAEKIEVLGQALQQAGKASDYGESLIEAYKIITGDTGKVAAQAREEGKLQGMAEANLVRNSTISPSQGGQTPKATVNLTEAEREIARAMGLSDQQYAEGKTL